MRSQSSDGKFQHLHRINGEQTPADTEPNLDGWAWGGNAVKADDPECLAKSAYNPDTGLTRYFVKRATYGPETGSMYNPQSPMFEAGSIRRVNHATGRAMYEFRSVTQEAFDLYVRFLKTGNPVNLRNAERSH